jgi:glycosyltransferase involved in cell wall biosynthesis
MLADYILLLLTNKELWREFSQSGRRRMLTYFDLKKQTARLEEIYDRVIASAPDRDPCEGRE